MDIKSYYAYLNSQHWEDKRRKISKRDNRTCFNCLGPHKEVHHINYRNLIDVLDSDLISACQKCHCDIHRAIDEGYIPSPHKNQSSIDLTKSGLKTYLDMRTKVGEHAGSLLNASFLRSIENLPSHARRKALNIVHHRGSIASLKDTYVSKKSMSKLKRLIWYHED